MGSESGASVRAYLRRAADAPLLTSEQEARLGGLVRVGDGAAESSLVESHLRLVVAIARRYAVPGAPIEELGALLSLGDGGLGNAARWYDPAKGFKFSTYATWWIRQAITGGQGGETAGVREPRRPPPSSGTTGVSSLPSA